MASIDETSGTSAERLLADVERSFEGAPERLREIMRAAVRHLHAFVGEVDLTHDEWMVGIEFLTKVGQACDATRQEFILLSDTLGVSSRVEMTGANDDERATEPTVLGPFYVPGSPMRERGDSILENADSGELLRMTGRVTDLEGRPLAGALVDVWQNASNGLYAVQDPNQDPNNLRGRFLTGDDGGFEFHTSRPIPYTVPDDGPVGILLRASGREPWRPAHVHMLVSAPGHQTLGTHVFDADSDHLHDDAVFGMRDSLVIKLQPDPDGPGKLARFDVLLAPTP